MSTIVYRDGVMAADTRSYTGHGCPSLGRKWKIRRTASGTLLGCSTNEPGIGELVMSWYEKGANPEDTIPSESFTLLVVTPSQEAYFAEDALHLSGPIEADYFAIGSGREYAYGALAGGATAEEAVKTACKFDVYSALPVRKLTHYAENKS